MRVIAKQFFISAAFGNVDQGRVLEVSDKQARLLIDNGLAKALTDAKPAPLPGPADQEGPRGDPSGFPPPAGQEESGASSQAGQASAPETVKPSETGVKKKRARKRGKSQ